MKTKRFILADGSEIKRRLGEAVFHLNSEQGTSPVIFGEEDDSTLPGSISLEVPGLMLDPFKRQLGACLQSSLRFSRTLSSSEAADATKQG